MGRYLGADVLHGFDSYKVINAVCHQLCSVIFELKVSPVNRAAAVVVIILYLRTAAMKGCPVVKAVVSL